MGRLDGKVALITGGVLRRQGGKSIWYPEPAGPGRLRPERQLAV